MKSFPVGLLVLLTVSFTKTDVLFLSIDVSPVLGMVFSLWWALNK